MNTPSSPAPGLTRTCLRIDDLRASYGAIPVLHGVSLQVRGGEIVGVLGHNGMGKSTLLKTAMGLLMPSTGAVRMKDRDLTRAPPHVRARAGIGYVPQGRGILATLSAEENLRLAFFARAGSHREQEALERVLAPRGCCALITFDIEATRAELVDRAGTMSDPRFGAQG
jgi:amidase